MVGQLMLLGLVFALSIPSIPHLAPQGPAESLAVLAGIGAVAIGGALVGKGIRGLGASLSPLPRPREGADLVQSGVYARIRHPIYAGLILASLGWGTLTCSLPALGAAALLAVFLDAKARREESWLLQHHDGYTEYKNRTKRFLPGIY